MFMQISRDTRRLAGSAALLFAAHLAQAQTPTVYKVGANEPYTTLTAAVAAAESNGGGADIQVDPGTYTNDFPQLLTGTITIEGVGGLAKFVATTPPPNEKALLDVAGNITVRYLELSGVAISDDEGANGAGIRYENGTLVVQNCFIHDNQDGILSNADPNGTITVDHTELSRNGVATGPRAGYEHNLYIGAIANFTLTNSFSHDAVVGHEVKSRALVTDIENTRIFDNSGTSSYSVDAPNGGTLTIRGSVIEQGVNGQNPTIFAVGEEGNVASGSSVLFTGNTVVNDLNGNVQGFLNPAAIPLTDDGTSLYGITVDAFDSSATNTTELTTRPTLDMSSPIQPVAKAGGLSPSTVSFPATLVGATSAAQTVTLLNPQDSGAPFNSFSFTGAAGDFPFTTNCNLPLNPGQSCSAQFSFAPSAAGARSATLNIFAEGQTAPYTSATFSGSGTAPAPLSFSPPSLSFPATAVGSSSQALTVQVRNPNSAAVYVTSTSLAGAAAGDFGVPSNSCGTVLPGQSTCSFTVVFSPSGSGVRGASLSVTTSASSSPQVLPFSGTGTPTP